VIQDCGDVQHEILLKLLFYTAVRVHELVGIRIENVDWSIAASSSSGARDSKTGTSCSRPAFG
jgi:integrase